MSVLNPTLTRRVVAAVDPGAFGDQGATNCQSWLLLLPLVHNCMIALLAVLPPVSRHLPFATLMILKFDPETVIVHCWFVLLLPAH
jgi:hypothetical protein